MKKTMISAAAIALFALPMNVQAEQGKMEDAKSKSVKPFSTMKSTMEAPSKSDLVSSAIKSSGKTGSMGKKSGAAQKTLEKAEAPGKKKAADIQK